ncbi:diiron oxygenase [Paenibacillus glucanolyticus]|uniref:diiron oxygenase n=1 Tax=Paenibacillus glucanolyticus TaxID=59843 RepID=UPI0036CF169F
MEKMEKILEKLVNLSTEDYYNPYKHFKWPERLNDNELWMTPELVSVYGTKYYEELGEEKRILLSKWESINFYSMNVHSIRSLLIEVIERVHMPGFEVPSRYFHHFVGEENEHMYFFAQFCLLYGKKIYQLKKMKMNDSFSTDSSNFIVFSQILIFEEIVDYYNLMMAKDQRLHPIIREINKIHHQDESRHIAFGRQLVKHMWDQIKSHSEIGKIRDYLKNYIIYGIRDFYNPAVYKDAGFDNAYEMRVELLNSEERRFFHRKAIEKVENYFLSTGIFIEKVF